MRRAPSFEALPAFAVLSALSAPPAPALALAVALALSLTAAAAEAAKGKISVENCGTSKIKLCIYDKTDVSLLVENKTVELAPGEWSTHVGCSSNGGCKVKVVKAGASCVSTTHETSIADATTLGEYAYRFNGASFDKASDDRAFFDNAGNRVCPGTPANLSFSALNCTGGSLTLCTYKDGDLKASSSMKAGVSTTLGCGKPDACTVIVGNCPLKLPQAVTYTLAAAAYNVTRRQSPPGTFSFSRVSSEVNYFSNGKGSCPPAR